MSTNELKPRTDFDDFYVYGDEIGKGRYATVKKCYCKRTHKCYAAKIIKNFRAKHSKLNFNIVENEINALTIARSHPSIINLYEIFQHKGETILVLEYATEKDLHIYLDAEGAFEERKACEIIYQLLKAIEFLHSKNVLHLDIKPENVLLMSPLTGSKSPEEEEQEEQAEIKVKLCDFSFSQLMKPGKTILGMMGTAAYSAPEILQYEELTKATDMWSLGVLTHVILTEYTPFGNGTEENNQTQTNILSVREKEFECVEDYFDNISAPAKNFIESLLKYRPKQRLTIEQALNHEWFKMLSNKNTSNIETKNETKLVIQNSTDKEVKESINNNNESTKIINDCTTEDKNNNNLSSVIEKFQLNDNAQSKPSDNNNNINNTNNTNSVSNTNCNNKKNEVTCEIKIKEQHHHHQSTSTTSISNESLRKINLVNTTSISSTTTTSTISSTTSVSKLTSNSLRSNKSASLLTQAACTSLSSKTGQVKLLKSANKSSSSIIDHSATSKLIAPKISTKVVAKPNRLIN